MKTEGHWVNVRVLAYNSDKSKILLEYEDGQKKWIDTEKIKEYFHVVTKDNIVGKEIATYITLPTMGSRHFGMKYNGFCLER